MRISILSLGEKKETIANPSSENKNGLIGESETHQLTDNVDVAELCFRRNRVDLTHVSTVIFFLDIVYM